MDEQKNFYNAATWGIWVWVGITVLPLLGIALCCFGCFGMGVIGSAGEAAGR